MRADLMEIPRAGPRPPVLPHRGQATNGAEVLAATSSALTKKAANQVEKLRNASAVMILLPS